MTTRERKLLKIVVAPMLKGVLPLPAFKEWPNEACNEFSLPAKEST